MPDRLKKNGPLGNIVSRNKHSSLQGLNIFQRGILQKIVSFAVYLICVGAALVIVDFTEKVRFSEMLIQAQHEGILSLETYSRLHEFIYAFGALDVVTTFFISFCCVILIVFLTKLSGKLNWAWPTTIAKAVEFRAAMRRLGLIDPKEQIAFVRKHTLPVFIAAAPLLAEEQEAVRAKLYVFAQNLITDQGFFERNLGSQTLCLDARDYAALLDDADRNFSLKESAALAERDEEINNLRSSLSVLTREHEALVAERDALRDKAQIAPAQTEGRVQRLRVERLIWAAYTPVIENMLADAPPGKRYTTPEIEVAFAEEWARRPDLRARMRTLTGSEDVAPSQPLLDAVKAEFKEVGLLSAGGRPSKNPRGQG